MGIVLATIFTSPSQLPLYFPACNKFEWTQYSSPRIQQCILFEFLVNPNIWHVKIPLIVYATVDMHESDRVMRQLGFRKAILPPPKGIRSLHKVNLWGRTDDD
ncbi:hypothetical protein PVK06_005615 [Gossypium arboreum]|uniref:Uncharacterized protein n=1 Tax=Gossypium arboreum TaxID=29729 RepID=A0ABR0QWB6_GOSAR|nr:hypothetical protein PVK06_005615 [Gossypium arboreum]